MRSASVSSQKRNDAHAPEGQFVESEPFITENFLHILDSTI